MDKKTVLHDEHVSLGAKIVSYAGFSMPVQYKNGVLAEHNAVRSSAGVFDISHMGEFFISGPDAEKNLQVLLTNDIGDMQNETCRYSPMCNEMGGIIDDLLVYKLKDSVFLLVVNASNVEKDLRWIKKNLVGDILLQNSSDETAAIALQGPKAFDILCEIADEKELPQKKYTFKAMVSVAGVECIVSRTGYTGEDGFELYCDNYEVIKLWKAIFASGEKLGLLPCGLAARDTLRLEAGMPLYGNDMNDNITPYEAGLGYFVKTSKDFIGKDKMSSLPKRRRCGLKIIDRGIAREHALVYLGTKEVGVVSSGTMLPFMGYAGAMAFLDIAVQELGTALEVDVRGSRLKAEVVKLPFYTKNKSK